MIQNSESLVAVHTHTHTHTRYNLLKNILIYTGLFTIIAGYIIYIFNKYDKSFIYYKDALRQHVVTLQYFRSLLVNFIKTGEFSTFTWSIGSGFSMFGNFAYYIFGDIFSYFSILVPTSAIETFYSAMIFVRLYFVGIAFLYFCKYKNMNTTSSIVGTLMYVFCSFALYTFTRHPFFTNAMIIFPLTMVGIEKIIVENKKIFYIVVIATLFIMNFYFAYMIAIILAVYGIILTIYTYKKDGAKKVINKLLMVFMYSLVGIMIAAVILLPTIVEFLNSERSGTNEIYSYTITYYRHLVANLIDSGNAGYNTFLGVQSIILIALPIFFRRRKQNYPIFWLMLVLLVPLLISQVASVLCGFSCPTNRWCFVFVFIFAFITTMFINDGSKLDKKDLLIVILFILSYLILNYIFETDVSSVFIIQIMMTIVIILLIVNKEKIEAVSKKLNLYNISIVCLVTLGILFLVFYRYEVGEDTIGYVSEFIDEESYTELMDTSENKLEDFNETIDYIQNLDSGFYRISKYPCSYENVSLIKNYKSLCIYYSIIPSSYYNMNIDLQNIQYTVNHGIKEFDYRTKITTLLGVKYYITNDKGVIPYGYTKLENYDGESSIYVNNYSLPFGVLYTDYITEAEYEEMTPLEKESSLLKTVVLNEEEIENTNLECNSEVQEEVENIVSSVDYTIVDEYEILKSDDSLEIVSTSENTLELEIGEVENSELYLHIEDMEYTPYSKEEIISLRLGKDYTKIEEEEVRSNYKWYRMDYSYAITAKFNNVTNKRTVEDYVSSPYYIDNDEMLFNLGYYDKTSGTITISFSEIGIYNFSSIKILAISMDGYEEDIENLSKSNFEVINYGNGYLSGTVNADVDGILQFLTIYNKGWTVYVDGEKVETMCVNEYFLGINIPIGEHTIYMEYSTPYLKIGAVISIIGILIFIGIIIYTRKKSKIILKLGD